MSQKEKQGRHGNVIREMAALRWEPTHITKHCPRVVPLHLMDISRGLNLSLELVILVIKVKNVPFTA